MSDTPVRTLVVWCLDWPIAAAGLSPEIPAAVLHANRVVACSAAARAEGVRRGLRRREAQASCPSLVTLDDDPARDARAFEPVVLAVERYTPRAEIVRPGVCAIATKGPARYFGGEKKLASSIAESVTETLKDVSTPCQIGIADGPFAAELAARQSTIVPIGESAAFLAPLSVQALGQPELSGILVRLGVRTLGALAALPTNDVLGRFGLEGAIAHRLARGLDERTLEARTPPPELTTSIELDPPVDRVDAAAFIGRTLAIELHEQMERLGVACNRISIEAETEHGECLSRLWRHEGFLSVSDIADRLRWQLDGWLSLPAQDRPTAGFTLLRLAPDKVIPDHGRQLSFWGGVGEADERAARALARVQGMLGPEGVVTAVLTGGRSPRDQVNLVPWGELREAEAPVAEAPWPGQVPLPSPSVVYDQPAAAEVVDDTGSSVTVTARTATSPVPVRVSVNGGAWQRIQSWAGPWPLDEHWWDPPAHRRRARFQVVTDEGSAWLLALDAGRWWVEAAYV